MSTRQSCKHCGSIVGVHQHSTNCPRFKACLHCGHDLERRDKKEGLKYHPFCLPLIDDGIIDGVAP